MKKDSESKKKMGNGTKVLLCLFAVCVVAGISVAITLALLSTNSNKKENTFVGDPGLVLNLYESDWDGSTNISPAAAADLSDPNLGINIAQDYSAGVSIPKNPRLYNASTNKTEWVALRVKYYIKNGGDFVLVPYSEIKKFTTIAFDTTNWVADTGNLDNVNTHYFYYQTALAKETSTNALFSNVLIKSLTTLNGITCNGDSNACTKKYYNGNGGFHFHFTSSSGAEFEVESLPEFKIEVEGSAQEKTDSDISIDDVKSALKILFP